MTALSRNFLILKEEITKLSQAKAWDEVLHEWRVDRIEVSDIQETCLCTHTPIIELCFLVNVVTNKTAMVGNVCVQNFMGLESEQLFAAYRAIAKDSTKAARPILIQYASDHGLINAWEVSFLVSIADRQARSLTSKQLQKRIGVNEALVRRIRKAPGKM